MRQLKGIDDTEPVIGTITSEQSVSVPVTGMQLTATTGLLECVCAAVEETH
jgi:hypothetical protein